MRRYRGEALPDSPRIAVVSNDAIGNYVVVTPLLQMLRQAHSPKVLKYFSGPRTQELWSKDNHLDGGIAFLGSNPRASLQQALSEPPFDLVVNVEWTAWPKAFAAALSGPETLVCGPCVGADGRSDLPFADDERGALWRDQGWIAPDLPERYPFLSSGFIGEIFCRLAYLEGEVPSYRVPCQRPQRPLPEVLIAMSASLQEKLWPVAAWRLVLAGLRERGVSVGLLGAPATSQRQFWLGSDAEQAVVAERLAEDLRGQFAMPEVVGALAAAKAVLTLDNGILHLAIAAGTPTVGLFREGIHRLWAPPSSQLRVLTPAPGEPVAAIAPETVLQEVLRALE